MKKLLKIFLIILGIVTFLIFAEYTYSQRWRLQKSVPVEEYEEYIVGEWISDKLYLDLGFKKENPSLPLYREVIYLSDNSLKRNKRFISGTDSEFSDHLGNYIDLYENVLRVYHPLETTRYHKNEIYFLSENYLVFNVDGKQEVYTRVKSN